MKFQRILGISIAVLLSLSVGGYWYVFVAGVPQLDGPDAIAAATDLNYQLVTYDSKVLGKPRTYGLLLPPDYNRNSKERYPVIFLLHGGHGDPTDWFKKAAALPIIQQLYTSQRLPPSIIITPDGNDDRGSNPFWDPQYIDGSHGKILSAIGDELVQEIKAKYHAKPEAKYWAIGGLSSGGWGALNIGLHNLQNFSVMFSHSGYFIDNSGAENSPMKYISKLKAEQKKRLSIYLDAGEGDGRFLRQSQQFHQKLDAMRIANKFNAFPGGHGLYGDDVGWNYWHKHLVDSLSYVGDRFREVELANSKPSQVRAAVIPKPHSQSSNTNQETNVKSLKLKETNKL